MLQPLHRKIDCVVRVVTPENIEFEYMVAGPFQRLPAFLVDFTLRMAVFWMIIFLMFLAGIRLGLLGFMLLMTIATLAFFVLSWLYGTVMESQFNGRTVGKMVFRMRAISADGRPINSSQAALRNLLRACDFMPPLTLTLFFPDAPAADVIPTCLIGLIAMTLTQRMQRVGDLAAGTMVVWEGRHGFHTNLQPEDPRAYALSELIPPTFQVSRSLARAVALYMERRSLLSPPRREEIASNLAKPLLQLFGLRQDTSSDLLLCAIYVRIYQSEDQRMQKMRDVRLKGPSIEDVLSRISVAPKPAAPAANVRNPYIDEPEIIMAEVLPVVVAHPVADQSGDSSVVATLVQASDPMRQPGKDASPTAPPKRSEPLPGRQPE